MIAIARFVVLSLLLSTVLYGCLRLYLRADARERLEAEWEERGRPGSRERFVALGLSRHAARIARPLMAIVYGLPLASVALIVYLNG